MSKARGSWWERLRAWSAEQDRQAFKQDWEPSGLDVAEEPLRSQLLERARRRRFWMRPPVIVEDAEFVHHDDAGAQLKLKRLPRPNTNLLAARGFSQQCFRASDGAEGVTRISVAGERAWRDEATTSMLVKRWASAILHWI